MQGEREQWTKQAIEEALHPGQIIDFVAGRALCRRMDDAVKRARLLTREWPPPEAVAHYEAFIAAAHEKIWEFDYTSCGPAVLGYATVGLYRGWVEARRAAGADVESTMAALAGWLDQYGSWGVPHLVAEGMSEAELRVFASRARERLDFWRGLPPIVLGNPGQRWLEILQWILVEAKDAAGYLELCDGSPLVLGDFKRLVRLYQRPGSGRRCAVRSL